MEHDNTDAMGTQTITRPEHWMISLAFVGLFTSSLARMTNNNTIVRSGELSFRNFSIPW